MLRKNAPVTLHDLNYHTRALGFALAHEPSQMMEGRLQNLKDGENQSSNEVSIGGKVCKIGGGVGR